jgi:hypothetical protein
MVLITLAPQAFDATIRVTNLHTMESYLVRERVVRDTVVLRMSRFDGGDKEQVRSVAKRLDSVEAAK